MSHVGLNVLEATRRIALDTESSTLPPSLPPPLPPSDLLVNMILVSNDFDVKRELKFRVNVDRIDRVTNERRKIISMF